MENKEGTTVQQVKAVLIAGLLGGVVTFALCGILLLLAALLISKGLVPQSAVTILCVATCAVSAWFGGRFAAKRGSVFPALCALASGILFCLLVFVTGAVITGGVHITGSNLIMMVGALLAATASGTLGNVGSKKAKKTTKSKKRK